MKRVTGIILSTLLCLTPAYAADNFDPETGLRIHNYTMPTPETVPGATRINVQKAHQLWQSGAAFIDVLPIPQSRYDELDGTWPEHPERISIPGSFWLPNTGFGRPDEDMQAYLRKNLTRIAGGPFEPIVVFCIGSCWMGWNAAQHAVSAGFENVYWFPEGTDAWRKNGFPQEVSEPVPVDVDL